MAASENIQIVALNPHPQQSEVLTPEALEFLEGLHEQFQKRRLELLAAREQRQQEIEKGRYPDFLLETQEVRAGDWQVAKTPPDLLDRRVEITGPVDAKMLINALNSGAKVFMADLEDATSPTWSNVVDSQINLKAAVRGTLKHKTEKREYVLCSEPATLVVRPRGWHMTEKNVEIAGERVSASLFDFGMYFFHNAQERLTRGTAPYFYLPKLESHLEARLWNDVFCWAQQKMGIPQGSIRATVLIETITAAFEMDEILYELREHSSGLNAGRWDYIFSMIKKFRHDREKILPDRSQITMTVPFMRAYTELLVKTCHRRGAHAIGGMAAFIPSRKDEKVNAVAIAKVSEDKRREAKDGFDGTWVAHPDLVAVAKDIFSEVLGENPHQKSVKRDDVSLQAADLLNCNIAGGKVTVEGVAENVRVAMQYITYWLQGYGAVGLNNLMEDVATAEISRAQLWQWLNSDFELDDGTRLSRELYKSLRDRVLGELGSQSDLPYGQAAEILDNLVLNSQFAEFLTLSAYEKIG